MIETLSDLCHILFDVRFHDWMFHAGVMGDGYFVQVRFLASDHQTHEPGQRQHGRKWYVSKHATCGEVVQTCLKAVLAAHEHEAREQFTYKGAALFQPHPDVDQLVALAGVRVERRPARRVPSYQAARVLEQDVHGVEMTEG
jgi:hypothetical protein